MEKLFGGEGVRHAALFSGYLEGGLAVWKQRTPRFAEYDADPPYAQQRLNQRYLRRTLQLMLANQPHPQVPQS